ncbi:ribose transport system permease protein [Sporomusaceae bacterium BoRhaA]|uniref:ABC transporter permease n=1 Tax=Pelorhabdus rhamnosifermentans TaxID=2772457 RepID=UPI001C063D26|nr:ABC transporter permease [Pelorhabdus rhamnosifermentans]MBU2703553.1 ribose transport system permease protein [Pelorhabdus rhamnosifermentans]
MDTKPNEERLLTGKGVNVKEVILKYSVYIVLACLVVIFSIISPTFLSQANIGNFFRQIPTVGIVTAGITMLIITGKVDLSAGSIAAFAGTAAAFLAIKGFSAPVVIGVAVLFGAAFGFINGFLITKFALDSFILTLGTDYMIRGMILFFTNGIYVKGVPEWFYNLSNTKVGSDFIFTNTLVFIVVVILLGYVMQNTRFGRYCYAVGSNPEAARLSGININMHLIKAFIIEGILAAVAGVLLMSNLNVGAPSEATGVGLFALAAAIIGGAAFSGGVGSMAGAVVGIFTLEVFRNGLAILGLNSFIQQAVTGGIIIVAVVIDYYRRTR